MGWWGLEFFPHIINKERRGVEKLFLGNNAVFITNIHTYCTLKGLHNLKNGLLFFYSEGNTDHLKIVHYLLSYIVNFAAFFPVKFIRNVTSLYVIAFNIGVFFNST